MPNSFPNQVIFRVELRSAIETEFLCLCSSMHKALQFIHEFDLSREVADWQEFVILRCQVDPPQETVHTANRLVYSTPIGRKSIAADLLKFAGTWQGDDMEECLQAVYDNRSEATF